MDFYDFSLITQDNALTSLKDLTQDWLTILPNPDTYALISNHPQNCDVYAPEIDWYLSNASKSHHTQATIAQNLKRLYFARLNQYEHSTQKDFSTPVAPSLLIIGDNQEAKAFLEFVRGWENMRYEVGLLHPEDIVSIHGHMGAFEAQVRTNAEILKVSFAQGVIFYEDTYLESFAGIENAGNFEDEYALMGVLDGRVGTYHYQSFITYDSQNCQYHHRRANKKGEGYCHKCANVCPTLGVSKNNHLMELVFSDIDCIGCGACVSVCPSGSMEDSSLSMQALNATLAHYKNTPILLIALPFLQDLKDFPIPDHIAPLIISTSNLLSEAHILALLQESGHSCVYYAKNLIPPVLEASKLINDIYHNIYQKTGFYIAQTPQELTDSMQRLEPIASYSYPLGANEYKRKHFSERLRFAIKDHHYGQVPSGQSKELVRYGQIAINSAACTLCMSCVGACNVGSLKAVASDLSLRFDASACTTCGYCVDSCPENAISLELSGITLAPSWFEDKIMASDTLFACIECGKKFATQKSIQKVKSMMTPLFGSDTAKIKALECCADCKVKIMFATS
ncbi:hypothetical protein BKH46_07595 [Helicobacter sp. 12S02634-8]|uniref:4Fe-4S binding protein n=1 Tax=Helicobacter sp. 12S02634-8 TaxID=1476199 RepID=UPI000BD9D751|nr:4Fe-4S binding protein [Helicobacter sp. 12S02634-8]PAF46444.1 hypothetical protein BKH46_07595 [Helicobacter sp. 12S02634-8]